MSDKVSNLELNLITHSNFPSNDNTVEEGEESQEDREKIEQSK